MDDSQDPLAAIIRETKQESPPNDDPLISYNHFFNDFEREIQTLERDIRAQKESSMNAKTAITFEQLKKIHNISKMLGPQKEKFFDRICRAAEIQRASLKNRLKQNKDRFEPANCLTTPLLQMPSQIFDSQGSTTDSQTFLITPNTQALLLNSNIEAARREDLTPLLVDQNQYRISAERQYELLVLGFSYTDLEYLKFQFCGFERLLKEADTGEIYTNEKVMEDFARVLSSKQETLLGTTEQMTLMERCYILLQLGNTVDDVAKILKKEKRKRQMQDESDECAKRLCLTPLEDTLGSPSPTLSAPNSEKKDD